MNKKFIKFLCFSLYTSYRTCHRTQLYVAVSLHFARQRLSDRLRKIIHDVVYIHVFTLNSMHTSYNQVDAAVVSGCRRSTGHLYQ